MEKEIRNIEVVVEDAELHIEELFAEYEIYMALEDQEKANRALNDIESVLSTLDLISDLVLPAQMVELGCISLH